MSRPNILYRCFAETGACLYIGITTQPGVRLRKHAEGKDWWSQVTSIRLEHYRTKDALEKAEKAAIAAEIPVYNVNYNPDRLGAALDYYDDGDPDEELENPDPHYVLVEYDGPEIELTDSERAESRACAEAMGQMLGRGVR